MVFGAADGGDSSAVLQPPARMPLGPWTNPQVEHASTDSHRRSDLADVVGGPDMSGGTSAHHGNAVVDSVLDDLAFQLVQCRALEARRAACDLSRCLTTVPSAGNWVRALTTSDARPWRAPAGPLASSRPLQSTDRRDAKLADIVLVAGYCGMGAGLRHGGKRRAKSNLSRVVADERAAGEPDQ